MKKDIRLLLASAIISLFLLPEGVVIAGENSGEAIFNSLKCTQCHAPQTRLRGPNLIKIAGIYTDVDQLLLFFSGKMGPIVEPERAKTMTPRLRKIKRLSDSDKKALASFIMGFKETP